MALLSESLPIEIETLCAEDYRRPIAHGLEGTQSMSVALAKFTQVGRMDEVTKPFVLPLSGHGPLDPCPLFQSMHKQLTMQARAGRCSRREHLFAERE